MPMTAEAPLADPPRPGGDAAAAGLLLDQRFDADTLHQLRAAVLAHVARSGLPEDRVGDVMIAVHELAANTVRHGAGAGQLVIRTEPGAAVPDLRRGRRPPGQPRRWHRGQPASVAQPGGARAMAGPADRRPAQHHPLARRIPDNRALHPDRRATCWPPRSVAVITRAGAGCYGLRPGDPGRGLPWW